MSNEDQKPRGVGAFMSPRQFSWNASAGIACNGVPVSQPNFQTNSDVTVNLSPDGAITFTTGGVSSLNGLMGNLSLIAGANVTITPSGNEITITAANYAPLLETNGAANGNQLLLNLVAGSNMALTDDGHGNITLASTAIGNGTVLSVGLSMPSIFSVSGSPITRVGTFGVSLTEQNANSFWSGPTSGTAPPTFRAINILDLFGADGSTTTKFLSEAGTWLTPASGGGGVTSLNSLTGDLSITAGANITVTPSGNTIEIAASGGSGTVTSVALTVPNILSVSGSPITTNGTLAISLANERANSFLAGPTSGSATTPTFRAINIADLFSADGSTTTKFLSEAGTWLTPSGSGVTSLNSLTGALSITAGSNISVTPSGSSIEISATDVGAGQGFEGVYAAKTSTYDIVTGDIGQVIPFNGSSISAVLPASAPAAPFFVVVINYNATDLTLNPNGLNLNGSSSSVTVGTNQSAMVWSDGSNYWYLLSAIANEDLFSIGCYAAGTESNSQLILRIPIGQPVTFPASGALSYATAAVASTGSPVFSVAKNGTQFATITFATSATGSFTQASAESFAAGDILSITGASTADSTLSGVGITLVGYKL